MSLSRVWQGDWTDVRMTKLPARYDGMERGGSRRAKVRVQHRTVKSSDTATGGRSSDYGDGCSGGCSGGRSGAV